MERLIATHHHLGHQLDILEVVDDDETTIRLVVDGELLPPDAHAERQPTEDEAIEVLTRWHQTGAGRPAEQAPNTGGLRPGEVIALLEALDDEHKAHATYAQVLEDFGPVRPFDNIVESEARHIEALTQVMERYEVPVPENPWPGRVPRYGSVTEACAAAVEAEVENAALYDRLLGAVERPDIRTVLQSLQEASQERHLPAFRRGQERGDDGEHHEGHHHRHRRHGA